MSNTTPSDKTAENDPICRCGHLHTQHVIIKSHNYSAGRCIVKGCDCRNFVIKSTNKTDESLTVIIARLDRQIEDMDDEIQSLKRQLKNPPQEAKPAPPSDEETFFGKFTYLIENSNQEWFKADFYWDESTPGQRVGRMKKNWTKNANSALKFYRKKDAEIYNRKMELNGIITEHEFISGLSEKEEKTEGGNNLK